MNNKKGFTLIELIVVLIIIGILVLLATPKFIRYIKLAKYTQIVHDVKVVEGTSLAHFVRNDEYPLDTNKDKKFGVTYLNELVQDQNSFIVEGRLVEDNQDLKEDYVGNLFKIQLDNIDEELGKPYYKLDDTFIKYENRSRLKGVFLINKQSGRVIYTESFHILEENFVDPEIDDKTPLPDGFSQSDGKYIYEKNDENPASLMVAGFDPTFAKDQADSAVIPVNDIKDLILDETGEIKKLRRVEKIKDQAFDDVNNKLDVNISIGQISILDNIKIIGNSAFQDYQGENFKLDLSKASNLQVIKPNAFKQYIGSNINFPKNNIIRTIGTSSFNNYNGSPLNFHYLTRLEQVGPRAFLNYEASGQVNNLNFSKSKLHTIGNEAFGNYKGKEVSLPASINELGNKNDITDLFGSILEENLKYTVSYLYPNKGQGTYKREDVNINKWSYEDEGFEIPLTISHHKYTFEFIDLDNENLDLRLTGFTDEYLDKNNPVHLVNDIPSDLADSRGDTRTVLEVSDDAFAQYSNLSQLVLPTRVEKIGSRSFKLYKGDKDLNIPSLLNLKEIGDEAFAEYSRSHNLDFSSSINLKNIGNKAFAKSKALELKMPAGIVDLFNSAESDFMGDAYTKDNLKYDKDMASYAYEPKTALTYIRLNNNVNWNRWTFKDSMTTDKYIFKLTEAAGEMELRGFNPNYKRGVDVDVIPMDDIETEFAKLNLIKPLTKVTEFAFGFIAGEEGQNVENYDKDTCNYLVGLIRKAENLVVPASIKVIEEDGFGQYGHRNDVKLTFGLEDGVSQLETIGRDGFYWYSNHDDLGGTGDTNKQGVINFTGLTNLKVIGERAFNKFEGKDIDFSPLTGLEVIGHEAFRLYTGSEGNIIDFSKARNLRRIEYRALKNTKARNIMLPNRDITFTVSGGFDGLGMYNNTNKASTIQYVHEREVAKNPNAYGFQYVSINRAGNTWKLDKTLKEKANLPLSNILLKVKNNFLSFK